MLEWWAIHLIFADKFRYLRAFVCNSGFLSRNRKSDLMKKPPFLPSHKLNNEQASESNRAMSCRVVMVPFDISVDLINLQKVNHFARNEWSRHEFEPLGTCIICEMRRQQRKTSTFTFINRKEIQCYYLSYMILWKIMNKPITLSAFTSTFRDQTVERIAWKHNWNSC